MKIVAYMYSDPLLETAPKSDIWGLEIDRVYQDFAQRQQWQQLITDCQTEPPAYLLIRRLSELGDTVAEIGDRLNLLESLGIEVVATEQDYVTSSLKTNLGRLLQEIQTNKYSDRLKQGHARNRLRASPPPGKAPYGYRRGQDKYIIDKSTAPVVKEFFERFLLYGSLRGAVRYLEKRYGKKISPSTGRLWLTNPVYRGSLAYKNGDIIPNTHAPILDGDEAAQIDRLLRRNSRLPSRTASAPRSLAGLVVCQQCQSKMKISRVTRRNKKQEYLYLRPLNCPRQPKCKAIAYQSVLQQTIERVCLDLPLAVAQLNSIGKKDLQQQLTKEITHKQEILTQLPALQQQGIFDRETAELRQYTLRKEIGELEAKLAQLPPSNLTAIAQAVSLPQFWLDLSEAERRFYFREFIKQIILIRPTVKEWHLRLAFIF